ncbi:MAG: OsmC family protein [Myxococcaceae bacterium]
MGDGTRGEEVVVQGGASGLRQEISAGGHQLVADEPTSVGGTGTGPTPYDLLLGALGACTSMTLRLYADRHKWPLQGVTVRLSHQRVHRDDCVNCPDTEVWIEQVDRALDLHGPLTEEQRRKLLDIAERCPVHRTLERRMQVRTTLVPPTAG